MRMLKSRATQTQSAALAVAAIAAVISACGNGVIREASEPSSGPSNPGPTVPGPTDPAPVDPGPTDPGPTDPGPTDPGPAQWTARPLDSAPPVTPSPRLKVAEYKNTAADAFSLAPAVVEDVQLAADGSDSKIFSTNAIERIGDFRAYVDAAEQLSEAISSDVVGGCEWVTATNDCIRSQLQAKAERLFRSSVGDPDVQEWAGIFSSMTDNGAPVQVAVSAIVSRMLLDERFLFHRESGEAPDAASTTVTDSELAARLSYLLTEGPPDEMLRAAVASGDLKAQVPAQIRRLLATPAADEMIWRFVSGWLSLPTEQPDRPEPPPPPPPEDECNLTSECKAIYGDRATDCVNSQSNMSWCACGAGVRCKPPEPPPAPIPSLEYSAWEETRRFVLHVFKSDTIPLSELFSANYSFIDATLAEHYGVPAPTQDWERYEFPAEAKRTGILSHASFLTRNSSHERDVSWIFRGKALYERMFCGELGLPMEGAIGEEVEDRQNHPFCGGCHSIMDPLGKLFDGYDETGKYIGTEFTMVPIFANSDIDGDYADLNSFAANIENSRAFDHCFVRMWFRFVLGRSATSTDQQSYDAALATMTSARTAKATMIKLLETEAFRSLYHDPSRADCQ